LETVVRAIIFAKQEKTSKSIASIETTEKIRTTNHKPPSANPGSGGIGSETAGDLVGQGLEDGQVGPLGRSQAVFGPRIDRRGKSRPV